MALLHDDVCITKNGFALAILKNHGFAVSRCWHHKSPYLFFIMLLASKRIISLRSRSRAPTKWPARWLPINYLIFYYFWSLSLPAIFHDLPIGLYIDISIFIQVCEPVSQKVCGTVEVAVPRYHPSIHPVSNHLKLGLEILSSYSLYYHDQTSVLPNRGGRLQPRRRHRQPGRRCCHKPRCCCPWRHLLKVSEMLVTNNSNIENWIFLSDPSPIIGNACQ